jgi:hypothetical protein
MIGMNAYSVRPRVTVAMAIAESAAALVTFFFDQAEYLPVQIGRKRCFVGFQEKMER